MEQHMERLFGTDGIRGQANTGVMTPDVVYNLGRAAGFVFRKLGADTVLVGKDGRLSGDMIECALVAGLCSVGVSVCRAGIVPTPAISHLTSVLSAQLGVMISASHNPMPDNGIKFFNEDGTKLDDELENEIECAYYHQSHAGLHPIGAAVGRVVDRTNVVDRYLAHVRQTVPRDFNLCGLTVVVDCANGATSMTSPQLLAEFGAEVVAINAVPDGLNINDGCGSTHIEPLRKAVATHLADLGIAHDGDGDRTLFVDETGVVRDGDHILTVCGLHMKQHDRLPGDTLVTTVLGNSGLDLTLAAHGISVERSPVGDRFVWEKMKEVGAKLGGEQAGHIIFGEYSSVGDGLITALQTLAVMQQTGKPLSELADILVILPQAVRNITVSRKPPLENAPAVQEAIQEAEKLLTGRGRIVVRYSGTEPLARVMIEGEDADFIESLADTVAEVIDRTVNG